MRSVEVTQPKQQIRSWLTGQMKGEKKVCGNINSARYAALTLVFSLLVKLKETKKKGRKTGSVALK